MVSKTSTRAVKLVVRKRKSDGKHYAGFASEFPLGNWTHVKDFGSWCGAQMSYQPFKRAKANAEEYAAMMNKKYYK